MVKFLFVNTRPAQCSIYKSGVQVFDVLDNSPYWNIDYCEIQELDRDALDRGEIMIEGLLIDKYDAYIFNYHDITMRGIEKLDSRVLQKLPGPIFSIILEMTKDNPLPRLFSDDFNGYLVMDPTMRYRDPRFIAFPRPLKYFSKVEYVDTGRPIIGSFGFPTQDKAFDRIVDAANAEFDSALIRLNIPRATYADPEDRAFNEIVELCRLKAKPGIDIEVTREFFSDNELVDWCAKNTINVFLYNRNMPGLAAVTDQAVASGRPLAISDNTTFRHVHAYLQAYPEQTLTQSIENSQAAVLEMQCAWSPEACQKKLYEVLFPEDANDQD
jgi:hypothetical protein